MGRSAENIVGRKFGRLTVVQKSKEQLRDNTSTWDCICECGNIRQTTRSNIGRGVLSCGCWRAEKFRTHGLSHTKVYRVYHNMLKRCNEEKNNHYHLYGGRGIKVSNDWNTFEKFFEDMGHVPKGKSLDRINPNGNYEKSNCRWATITEQMNNLRKTRYLTFNGVTKSECDWAREYGIDGETFQARLRRGIDPWEALTKPLERRGKHIKRLAKLDDQSFSIPSS